ncbi:LysR family transcriptional regulator [Pseudoxanthomonas suwonensis]|uniref:HTH lysR-type domain-containing protein n=1 Tax=Pseudoxanthomonas suwonensis TaxID=314722 RepID=A0A0E3Z124_9GAMM|nr:LysR family transcriptional regulator [Pseudoxanthomonas suwonensis]AKC86352.1 hypothetical protein WQ53_05765 [Pseudoxanthomonas suwonensis]
MSIKLRQLSHILALEEYGSFSRAAASLHISQPALSRSIQALEGQIGAPLFLREGHGVVPTDLGRVLIEDARQITRMADDLHERLLGNPVVTCHELSIGAGPFPAEALVGRAVAAFIGAHPRCKVRVEVRNWDELLPRLRNHELDLFVAETSTLEHERDLRVEPLSRHPLYFLARAGHPLAGQPYPGLGGILRHPLAALARIPPRLLEPALAALSRSVAEPVQTEAFPALLCSDHSLVKRTVCGSDAIMVSSLACVARELERGELVVLGTEPWLQLNYGMVTLGSRLAANTAVQDFRARLIEAEKAVQEEEQRLASRWVPGKAAA